MLRYAIKRFLYMILTTWIIISITFLLMHTIPGDPLAAMGKRLPAQTRANLYAKYGLDKPLSVQYMKFMKGLVLHGDLGESYSYPGMTVNSMIKKMAPVSGVLGAEALIVGLVFGVVMGIVAALKKNSVPDYIVMFVAIAGIAVPSFVLAALLQYFFTVKIMLFPTTGWGTFRHTVLPALAMSFGGIATYARFMRSSCVEVLSQDYILTAEAKGVSRRQVVTKHVLRNASMPLVTMLGPQIAGIFTGTFIIESIFSIPGIGRYFVTCVSDRDFPVILGTTIFIAVLFIVSIFVVDIVYGLIDPRVKLSGKK